MPATRRRQNAQAQHKQRHRVVLAVRTIASVSGLTDAISPHRCNLILQLRFSCQASGRIGPNLAKMEGPNLGRSGGLLPHLDASLGRCARTLNFPGGLAVIELAHGQPRSDTKKYETALGARLPRNSRIIEYSCRISPSSYC